MNAILKELEKFPKGPKVSMLLEWRALDHTFNEVRVWLSNIRSKLKAEGKEIPVIIDRILNDNRVFGSELNLNGHLSIGEKYAALYFGGDRMISVNIPMRVRDLYFTDDEFFVLPLLKSTQPQPVLVVFMKQNAVKVFKISAFKEITDITAGFHFPESSREFSHFDPGQETGSVQKGEEPRQIDHRQGYLEEVLKKYTCQVIAELAKSFNSFSRMYVFCSQKMTHLVESEVERLNKGFEAIAEPFIVHHMTLENMHKVIREKVIERENVFNLNPSEEFSRAPVTDIRELIWDQELGKLRTLRINEGWLARALGQGPDHIEQLRSLNHFVLSCLRKNVDVRLSGQIDKLLAGELYGDRVRVPASYQSPQFQTLERIRS